MSTTQSHWRRTAERVIAEALAKLPAGADRKTILHAVDSAYPFCERRYWPYKKWLEARRDMLHKHDPVMFPKKIKPVAGPNLYEEPAGPRLF